jgi:hypothetical protein
MHDDGPSTPSRPHDRPYHDTLADEPRASPSFRTGLADRDGHQGSVRDTDRREAADSSEVKSEPGTERMITARGVHEHDVGSRRERFHRCFEQGAFPERE